METQRTEIQQCLIDSKKKKFTLVVLGESGVGKTSWINSFVNFLSCDTFEDAINNNKLYYLIPSTFQHENEKPRKRSHRRKRVQDAAADENVEVVPKEVQINVGGNHPNEKPGIGESCTQEPFSYQIKCCDDVEVTIIDTPGIRDSRGDQQDVNNVTMILNHLGSCKSIDAFVILLQPGTKRLTPELETCVQLLFTQMNKSAANNVVFGFTNSKNANFKATDTKGTLRKLFQKIDAPFQLDEKRCFFFDSSPFIHLAILVNKQSPDSGTDIQDIWEKNIDSWLNLLYFVSELQPHDISNTLSIQKARLSINSILAPMLQIKNSIRDNADQIEKEVKNAEKAKSKRDILTVSGKIIRYAIRPWPQLVCNHVECIEMDDKAIGSSERVISRRICHQPCFEGLLSRYLITLNEEKFFCEKFMLDDISNDVPMCTFKTQKDENIIQESVSIQPCNIKTCVECSHNANDHECKFYNYKVKIKENMFSGTIEQLNTKAKDLRGQADVIHHSVKRMTVYINDNALVKDKRLTADDIQERINTENDVDLREIWQSLQKEVDNSSAVDKLESPSDVEDSLEKLFTLEEAGEQIKNAYELIKEGEYKQFQYNDRNQLQLTIDDISFIQINEQNASKQPVENSESLSQPSENDDC